MNKGSIVERLCSDLDRKEPRYKCATFYPDPVLLLNGMQIPVVEQAKFLGVIFDRKLTFVPHLRYLRQKCMKALNLLRVVAHAKWGSDEATLLHLYRSLIRSKLD